MNYLTDVMSPATRKKTYAWFASLGVILGGVQVGFAAAEAAQPVWLTVALAVYAFFGGAMGATANANVVE